MIVFYAKHAALRLFQHAVVVTAYVLGPRQRRMP